jgi:hypothetical protein
MAVAFQAKGTSQTTSVAATSTTFTKLTVVSGSNLALVVAISFGGNPGAFTKKNWDDTGTPQALTQIGTATESDNLGFVYLFGLVNPTLGAKTLALTWTNSVDFCYDAVSVTGADQTGGATTFKNVNSFIGSPPSPATISITSPSGDMAVAGFATSSNGFVAISSGTLVYLDNTNISGAMVYNPGSGATACAVTLSSSALPLVIVGCDIAAAGAADVLMPQIWL